MKEFFQHAWANPRTTFGITGAVLTLLAADLADGQPFSVAKLCHIAAAIVAVFAGAAASDSQTVTGEATRAARRVMAAVAPIVAVFLIFVITVSAVLISACTAAGPIAQTVASALCQIFVPLTASSTEGTIIAGTICQDFVPLISPIVTGVVASMAKADRVAIAARMASSVAYVQLRLNGQRIGSIDPAIAQAGVAAGKWKVGADGSVDVTIVDGGTK
jgi:hypothetical protein